MSEAEKLRALLPHWIEHNAEHAVEFLRWLDRAGEAASDIEEAAAQMERVNRFLSSALEKLGGPLDGARPHRHEHSP
jgi:hypothetical protein